MVDLISSKITRKDCKDVHLSTRNISSQLLEVVRKVVNCNCVDLLLRVFITDKNVTNYF